MATKYIVKQPEPLPPLPDYTAKIEAIKALSPNIYGVQLEGDNVTVFCTKELTASEKADVEMVAHA